MARTLPGTQWTSGSVSWRPCLGAVWRHACVRTCVNGCALMCCKSAVGGASVRLLERREPGVPRYTNARKARVSRLISFIKAARGFLALQKRYVMSIECECV